MYIYIYINIKKYQNSSQKSRSHAQVIPLSGSGAPGSSTGTPSGSTPKESSPVWPRQAKLPRGPGPHPGPAQTPWPLQGASPGSSPAPWPTFIPMGYQCRRLVRGEYVTFFGWPQFEGLLSGLWLCQKKRMRSQKKVFLLYGSRLQCLHRVDVQRRTVDRRALEVPQQLVLRHMLQQQLHRGSDLLPVSDLFLGGV